MKAESQKLVEISSEIAKIAPYEEVAVAPIAPLCSSVSAQLMIVQCDDQKVLFCGLVISTSPTFCPDF